MTYYKYLHPATTTVIATAIATRPYEVFIVRLSCLLRLNPRYGIEAKHRGRGSGRDTTGHARTKVVRSVPAENLYTF